MDFHLGPMPNNYFHSNSLDLLLQIWNDYNYFDLIHDSSAFRAIHRGHKFPHRGVVPRDWLVPVCKWGAGVTSFESLAPTVNASAHLTISHSVFKHFDTSQMLYLLLITFYILSNVLFIKLYIPVRPWNHSHSTFGVDFYNVFILI